MRSGTLRIIVADLVIFSLLGCQGAAAQWPNIKFPKRQTTPPPNPAAIEAAATIAIAAILKTELPIKLDAKSLYPTTSVLPGGPFVPRPLDVTAETIAKPLPPGDYTFPVTAFCTEHSAHWPGRGAAYEMGPLQGKDAEAVATLLWRGVFLGIDPHHLQAVSWGIESGLTYAQMPQLLKDTIDQLIPDYKGQLSGNFPQKIEAKYKDFAKISPAIPPLEAVLQKLGKPGEVALAAEREQAILLQKGITDQVKEQNLFIGQNDAQAAPLRAEEGPWTVMAPGVAFTRFKVVQGNIGMNTLEVRILPRQQSSFPGGGHLLSVGLVGDEGVWLLELLGVKLTPQLRAALAQSTTVEVVEAGGAGAVTTAEAIPLLTAAGIIGFATIAAQALIVVLTKAGGKGNFDYCREEWIEDTKWCDNTYKGVDNLACHAWAAEEFERCKKGEPRQPFRQ